MCVRGWAVGVRLCFGVEEMVWQGQNGQMINDQGECFVGGTLQHRSS